MWVRIDALATNEKRCLYNANRFSDSFLLQCLFFVLHAPYDLAGRSDMRPQDKDLKIALGRVGPPKHLRDVTLG